MKHAGLLAAESLHLRLPTTRVVAGIGDGAMVMSKCTIAADVGEAAMIGAHSLVLRPVPARCLAAGVPAGVLRRFDQPARVAPAAP